MSEINPKDEGWFNIYINKPDNGQLCKSKIQGEEGYVGSCIYNNGYFETYQDLRNRLEITRWKHDLWLPLNN